MKPVKPIVVLLISSFIFLTASGQDFILKLWPEGIPGSTGNDTYPEISTTAGRIKF